MTCTPKTIAAHHLTGSVDQVLDAASGQPFDLKTYSLMKHGDTTAIRALGAALADAIMGSSPELATAKEEVLLPVAYKEVPPSCFYLAEVVRDRINAARGPALPPARIIKITKDSVTRTDYAASSQAEREAEMARIHFELAESVDGAHVVLLDDVRVTGLAEKTALATFADQRPISVLVGYVAIVDEKLAADPHVEAAMNHHTVKGIADMLPAIERGEFALTIRFLKRVLGTNPTQFSRFLSHCPTDLLITMRDGVVASGTSFTTSYAQGFEVLNLEISHREH